MDELFVRAVDLFAVMFAVDVLGYALSKSMSGITETLSTAMNLVWVAAGRTVDSMCFEVVQCPVLCIVRRTRNTRDELGGEPNHLETRHLDTGRMSTVSRGTRPKRGGWHEGQAQE